MDDIELRRHITETWTGHKLAILVRMWGDKASASAIARALGNGITRNAVIGKARRMGLGGRPSPIIRDGSPPRRPRQKKLHGGQRGVVEARARTVNAEVGRAAPPPPKEEKTSCKPSGHRPSANDNAGQHPRARTDEHGRSCAWPMGDPREPGFHFCGARPVLSGKSYCQQHYIQSIQRGTGEADAA